MLIRDGFNACQGFIDGLMAIRIVIYTEYDILFGAIINSIMNGNESWSSTEPVSTFLVISGYLQRH